MPSPRVQLHPNDDGSVSVTADSPDQDAYGIAATTLETGERSVMLEIASVGAAFTGELSEDGQTLTGTFRQGAVMRPLTLHKQPGPLEHARPQDPRPPLPYESLDVRVSHAQAGVELACTLAWPRAGGPFDAVLLIGGSGPQNRDEELANHRPFLVLSDALARADVAALRCDDRGFAASTGDFASATSLDFAADARAAVRFLLEQSHFAITRVGLIGHSEGGLIAPLVADMMTRSTSWCYSRRRAYRATSCCSLKRTPWRSRRGRPKPSSSAPMHSTGPASTWRAATKSRPRSSGSSGRCFRTP